MGEGGEGVAFAGIMPWRNSKLLLRRTNDRITLFLSGEPVGLRFVRAMMSRL